MRMTRRISLPTLSLLALLSSCGPGLSTLSSTLNPPLFGRALQLSVSAAGVSLTHTIISAVGQITIEGWFKLNVLPSAVKDIFQLAGAQPEIRVNTSNHLETIGGAS